MNKDNYSAEGLKNRGHGVIDESLWKDFEAVMTKQNKY